jgi:hypothetical protein
MNIIVYSGSERLPAPENCGFHHHHDEFYFAPIEWSQNPCPFSPGFDTVEAAELAAGAFEARREWAK